MLKRYFILIAFAFCGIGCGAAHAAVQAQEEWVRLGGHEVHPTRILVRYKQGATVQAQETALSSSGMTVRRRFQFVPGLAVLDGQQGGYSTTSATPEERAEALAARIEALRNTGQFEFVEPDYIVRPSIQPSDAAFQDGTLWGLRNTGVQGGAFGADIAAEFAWEVTTGSTNVVVAVIDTGVRYTHQDLASQMWRNPGESGGGKENNGIDDDGDGYVDNVFGINAINGTGNPFDDDSHGTHVAGTIGAQANGGGPHVGVAWNVRIMALKFLGFFGGTTSDAIECINFAVLKGVRISNNSWGGGGFSTALLTAITAARDAGHLFIAAAGNEALDNDMEPHYPSNYELDNIISVAALDRADQLADFSNYGATSVDLGAPGVDIFSSVATGDANYEFFQGTSMAAPHVSGVAALLLANSPSATYSELRNRILESTIPVGALAGRCTTGGRLNAATALGLLPDGQLEMSVSPANGSAILGGSVTPVFAFVSDLFPLTNATVTGTVSGGGSVTFQNNGAPPDQFANDAVYSGNLDVPVGISNLTLTVTATAPDKIAVTNVLDYLVIPPPPNDNFSNATKIAAAGGLVIGNNQFATRENGEPLHAQTSGARSLWWNWSQAASGPVLVDTAGSSFDTVLGVYTGNSVGALTEIASVDDVMTSGGNRLQGYVSFDASAGVTYRIAVASFATNLFGTIRLRVEPNGSPDTNAPVVFITSHASGTVVSTNQISVGGTSFDPAPNASGVSEVQLRVNNSVPPKTAAGTTNWSTTLLLSPGVNTIAARAFDFSGNLSSAATITVTYIPPPPPNDHFVNATALVGDGATSEVNSTLATKEFREPNHANNEGGKSVWWNFTAPGDGVLFLSTSNSTFDTLLGVYSGSHVTNLTELANSDDAGDGLTHSELTLPVESGTTNRIAVDGYAGASGTVQLTHSFTPSAVYSLAISNTVGGTVTPSSGLAAAGSTVTLTALPDQNFGFQAWEGSVAATTNPLSIVVTGNLTLTARFSLLPHTDGFESGNLLALGWTTTGNAPWIVQNTNVSSGAWAARSGIIGNNQLSSLFLTMDVQAGNASFDFRVSSEEGWDFLSFYVDGILRQQWSGEMGWETYIFPVVAGSRTFEWRYKKDPNTSAGFDAAFIDNLDLPLSVPVGPGSAAQLGLRRLPDGSFIVDLTGQVDQTYVLQVSPDLLSWQPVSTNKATGGVIQFPVSNTGGTRYYRAVVPIP